MQHQGGLCTIVNIEFFFLILGQTPDPHEWLTMGRCALHFSTLSYTFCVNSFLPFFCVTISVLIDFSFFLYLIYSMF